MKKHIRNGIHLLFFEEDNGMFSFSSEDPTLQKWVDTYQKKLVRNFQISGLVKAAREYLKKAPRVLQVDYISELNHLAQRNGKRAIYRVSDVSGSKHERRFTMAVCLGSVFAEGNGDTKQIAKANAAKNLLEKLGRKLPKPERNCRQQLYESCAKRQLQLSFETTPTAGGFQATCYVDGEPLGRGLGASKKLAQENAAREAYPELLIS